MASKVTRGIGAVSVALLLTVAPQVWAASGEGETEGQLANAVPLAGPGDIVKQGGETGLVQVTSNSAVAIESDRPFSELSIANPEIADISIISETLVYVLGKRPGNTTLMLLGQDGELMRVVDVRVVPDISEFTSRLELLFPDQEITAITANDGIVLMGEVESEAVMKQAAELASHYAPGQISNLMTLKPVGESAPDVEGFERRLRSLVPGQEIAIEMADGRLVLSGEVESASAVERATKLAEDFAPGKVTSLLTVREASAPLPDVGALAATFAQILPDEKITAHVIGDTIVLSGTASSQETLLQASEIAKMLYKDATVSNMLTVKASAPCVVRTRKAGEMTEVNVPCQN